MNKMMTTTKIAKMLRISPSTIKKWEKTGMVKKAKRNQRGWRCYDNNDAEKLMAFYIVKSFIWGLRAKWCRHKTKTRFLFLTLILLVEHINSTLYMANGKLINDYYINPFSIIRILNVVKVCVWSWPPLPKLIQL